MKRSCPLCGNQIQDPWNETDGVVCKPPRGCGATVFATRRRVCRETSCITRLSVRDPGPFCFAHTPDLTDGGPAHIAFRDRGILRRPMADAFVAGIDGAYVLTRDDRESYQRGDW